MPKIELSDEDLGELKDLLVGEIDRLRHVIQEVTPNGPCAVEMKHRESVLLEILEVLEDA